MSIITNPVATFPCDSPNSARPCSNQLSGNTGGDAVRARREKHQRDEDDQAIHEMANRR